MSEETQARFAFVTGVDHRERLVAYLPASYAVLGEGLRDSRPFFVIGGRDVAGWTLDGFVLPRLASGLIFGEEVDEAAARAVVASSSRPDAFIGLPPPAEELAEGDGFFVEFENDDVGPFSSRAFAAAWGEYEAGSDFQVFRSTADRPFLDHLVATIPPLEQDVATARNLEHVTSLPRPGFDPRVDYPERYGDGPY